MACECESIHRERLGHHAPRCSRGHAGDRHLPSLESGRLGAEGEGRYDALATRYRNRDLYCAKPASINITPSTRLSPRTANVLSTYRATADPETGSVRIVYKPG